MPFQPGQSGNPAGRPRGSRNKGTVIAEKLLDDSAGALTTAAIKCATEGDPAALRACMDRIAPRLRHRPLDFALPSLVTLADTPGAINAIAQGLAHGELDRDEAVVLMRAVREFTLALAAVEREKRATGSAAPPNDDAASGGETLADFLARRTREAESGIATLAPVHDGRRQHEPEERRQEHDHDARRDQAAARGPHAARTPPQRQSCRAGKARAGMCRVALAKGSRRAAPAWPDARVPRRADMHLARLDRGRVIAPR
jgi:hypothetical protein